MTQFELIELSGNAYERGRQYGARAAAAIGQTLQDYLALIEFHGGLKPEAALEAAAGFGPIMEAHAPDLLQEMQGIADGAGCDLVHILLINARSELMGMTDECTALAAGGEVTHQGQVLLAQNWDWYTAVDSAPVLLHIRQPGKPEILTVAEAGQVAKIGLNSAGLGVCLNFLSHTDRGRGLPIHVILRLVLGCAALGEAVWTALSGPRGGAGNILLAHAAGEILDLELTATDADYVYADANWLVHANHFETPRLRGGDQVVGQSASTLARAARARRLMAADAGRGVVSMDSLQTILTDHTYGAYAICRHPEAGEDRLQQSATCASVIMDLSVRTLHLAAGQPCQEAFRPYTFPF